MVWGIEKELLVLIQAILTGNMLYLVYAGFSIVRNLIKHTNFFVAVEDLIYWGFVSIYIFLRLQKICNGNVRWYFVLGLLGGGLITYGFIRKIIRIYIDKSKKTE